MKDPMHDRSRQTGQAKPTRITYAALKVSYLDPGEPSMPTLKIDGTDVMVVREDTGGFSAPMLNMFATYPTLEDLARSLIDSSPVFLARR